MLRNDPFRLSISSTNDNLQQLLSFRANYYQVVIETINYSPRTPAPYRS